MIAITDSEFMKLAEYIKENYGIWLKKEKQALVESRLHNEIQQGNFKNFTEYFDHVLSDKSGNSVTALINRITTNHTFFMREAEHFNYFRDIVLPALAERIKDRDLRIWCAGCSTGEEPYTLAMIINDFFGPDKKYWDTRVLATDISGKVLETAVQGVYPNEDISTLPLKWRNEYFHKISSEKSVIIDKIKNEVIYRKFNLMETVLPFKKKFHVIFCRNVMIYFDGKTKDELTNRFYNLTESGGHLFIGHSESLDRNVTRYKYIMPAVYRKE